jgi:hypothetical protein
MSLDSVCGRFAGETGSFSPSAYRDCMGSSSYRREHDIHATNREVAAGTVPPVELTDGENLIAQFTGDNAYRVQQIAGAVTGDTREANKITSDDIDSVLDSETLNGQPVSGDMKRALEYMRDNFHDMTDEWGLEFYDTGDLSSQEILDYATNEIDASESEARRKYAALTDSDHLALPQSADSRRRGNQTFEDANGREFSRERGNDNVTYEVRKGDNVTHIARDLMEHRLGRKPSSQELRAYLNSVSLANGLYQNGRNPDLIRIGESLVFPPFER